MIFHNFLVYFQSQLLKFLIILQSFPLLKYFAAFPFGYGNHANVIQNSVPNFGALVSMHIYLRNISQISTSSEIFSNFLSRRILFFTSESSFAVNFHWLLTPDVTGLMGTCSPRCPLNVLKGVICNKRPRWMAFVRNWKSDDINTCPALCTISSSCATTLSYVIHRALLVIAARSSLLLLCCDSPVGFAILSLSFSYNHQSRYSL